MTRIIRRIGFSIFILIILSPAASSCASLGLIPPEKAIYVTKPVKKRRYYNHRTDKHDKRVKKVRMKN